MASETFEVYLQGGSPWGFRLQGGKEFRAPLLIAKVSLEVLFMSQCLECLSWNRNLRSLAVVYFAK